MVGESRTFIGVNYIYAGTVKAIDGDTVSLDPAWVVYNTGSHESEVWADAKALPGEWCVNLRAVESYGKWKDS